MVSSVTANNNQPNANAAVQNEESKAATTNAAAA